MVMIDNLRGICIINGGAGTAEAENIHIYGETDGEDDKCSARYGFLMTQHVNGSKDLHPLSASSHPIDKVKSYATW
jgi:hypothetical protein